MKLDVICVGDSRAEVIFTTKSLDPSLLVPRLRTMMRSRAGLEASEATFGCAGAGYSSAVAFARLGLKTSLISQVGNDELGGLLKQRLKLEGVLTPQLKSSTTHPTSVTSVIRSQQDDRLNVYYNGKAQQYEKKALLPREGDQTTWLYITSLGGDVRALKELLDWAKKNNAKVGLKPSREEIMQPRRVLKLLGRADVVIFERDDAELLTHQGEVDDILVSLRNSGLKTVVVHDEAIQAWAVHDGFLYEVKSPRQTKNVSSGGVSEAFGSGFLACYHKHNDVERALDFGLVEARSVANYIGSEAGLLRCFTNRTGKVAKKFL